MAKNQSKTKLVESSCTIKWLERNKAHKFLTISIYYKTEWACQRDKSPTQKYFQLVS